MAVITVIGLGSMGLGMALSLRRAGHRVIGCDLHEDAAKPLLAEGGESGPPREAAAQSDIVVSVVLNAAQTEAVLFGPDGCAEVMKPGSAILSCATVPPEVARTLAAKAEALGAEILCLCVDMGGCLTGEHGVGVEKRDLMVRQYAPGDLDAQMSVKDVFDPLWLLNPCKVFPIAASDSRRAA